MKQTRNVLRPVLVILTSILIGVSYQMGCTRSQKTAGGPILMRDSINVSCAPPSIGYSGNSVMERESFHYPGEFNTEEYAMEEENRFRDTFQSPLSTFSIDVDTASYSNVRRFLNSGRIPTQGAVRLEELINYFVYSYPEPENEVPVAFATEYSVCPWNTSHGLLHIGMQAKRVATRDLPRNNLVFLIDVSGSMRTPYKLPLVKASMRLLVENLKPEDRVAIVVYAGASGVALPSTSGADKRKILASLDALRGGGSTAGGQGIKLAYRIAQKNHDPDANNRVILATDGDFNVGLSSESELGELIEKKRKSGIYLTVLGFGTGNFKDARMETLADKGNGNYAYIDSLKEGKKVLVNEMAGTLLTVANDVKIQIEFNPEAVSEYRLLGYENRMLNSEDFEDDNKDAGEIGAGHTVTVLYEIIPAKGMEPSKRLRYQETKPTPVAETGRELAMMHLRYKLPDESTSRLVSSPVSSLEIPLLNTSDNYRFAAAVAEWGLVLRNSAYSGHSSYERAVAMAKTARGEDSFGYRSEFIELVNLSSLIAGRIEPNRDPAALTMLCE